MYCNGRKATLGKVKTCPGNCIGQGSSVDPVLGQVAEIWSEGMSSSEFCDFSQVDHEPPIAFRSWLKNTSVGGSWVA